MPRKTKPKTKEMKLRKVCPECSNPFWTNRPSKRFCSPSCRFKAWDKVHPRMKVESNG